MEKIASFTIDHIKYSRVSMCPERIMSERKSSLHSIFA